jgi:cation:H+ antiporter
LFFAFLFWAFVFAVSLFILIYTADLFVDKAKELGRNLGLSTFLIGLIIVSIGTTLPELSSSIYATIKGESEIVIPTVIGSVTTNIFLVIGLVGFLYGTKYLYKETIKTDLWIFATVSCLFVLFIVDNNFTIIEAILCVLIYLAYSAYQYKFSKSTKLEESGPKSNTFMCIFLILIYSFLIYVGSKYVVDSMLHISKILNIFPEIIAITVIALGTSLTELTVGLVSLRKGHLDIAVANIIGASIIDLLIVTSVSRFFGFIIIPTMLFKIAIPIFGLSIISFIYVILDKKLTKMEGVLLLLMYIIFSILMFVF